MSCNRGNNWSEREIKELLLIRGEEEISRQIDGTVRDNNVYCSIAEKLRLCGVQRDKKQVTAKLKSLKGCYLKTKDYNNTSGVTPKSFPFYDMCDNIWGHRPCASPVNAVGCLTQTQEGAPSPNDNISADGDDDGNDDEHICPPTRSTTESTSTPPRKKRRMSKADHVQAMNTALLKHLNESEEKFFAREEQLLQMQREWEKEAELRQRETVLEMTREIRAMQQETVTQFGNILASVFPSNAARSTVHHPFTHQWRSGTSAAPSTVPHSYSEEEPYERVMPYI
ncbi:uncharacterized protein LOC130564433 [Triplophysa rosa]|uniref:Myb/SANT-like DNA-binding domain-containing protein n=1 Tax=Triplophysa rosa TaxID=992332 RepID=A0A9W7WGC6_TRIRA|nr:uncharacterized protein LOC130564433 [Triplophysa rosa]KAI7800552.1 hypothetical protein IRJ41_005995 [Triplophysa rosa]